MQLSGEYLEVAFSNSRDPFVFVCVVYYEVFDLVFSSVPTVHRTLLHGHLSAVV